MYLEGQYAQMAERGCRGRRGTRDAGARTGEERGYAMAALLVALASMAILWTVAVPAWRTLVQREKEAELIFRAGQYAHAIALYQRRFANAYPPSVDVLVQQKFLRKKYKDPITNQDFKVVSPAELQAMPGFGIQTGPAGSRGPQPGSGAVGPGGTTRPGGTPAGPGSGTGRTTPSGPLGQSGREVSLGGVAAVVSRSSATSIRIYKNRQQYNQWIVTVDDVSRRIGAQPTQPGQQPGRPGTPSAPGSTTPGRPGGLPGTRPPGG